MKRVCQCRTSRIQYIRPFFQLFHVLVKHHAKFTLSGGIVLSFLWRAEELSLSL
jgi:hypothetical protein